MNEKSEQIDAALNYVIDVDQPLDWRSGELVDAVRNALGSDSFSTVVVELSEGNHKVAKYCATNGVVHYFCLAAVTFLGGDGNHPIFKKRIQLKRWYKECYYKLLAPNVKIHFMGVYHYKGNVLFVDFAPETYIENKMHNSSAFVYTNDLYRAMKDGIAFRRDFNGHGITTISRNKLTSYLGVGRNGSVFSSMNDLVGIFDRFNSQFPFLRWVRGLDAIQEMAENKWPDWRQTEWAGWFLEYKFSTFVDKNKIDKVEYCKNKKKDGRLDFDLWFPSHKFYGDLKASDETCNEAPGNDQEAFMAAINRYDRFWYVIYEHATLKDSESRSKFAIERKEYILTRDGVRPVSNSDKKHRDLKYAVCFRRMLILEVNRFNYQEMLKTFNQGRQPNGRPRRQKYNIKKHLPVELENYQVLYYAPRGKVPAKGCYSVCGKSTRSQGS